MNQQTRREVLFEFARTRVFKFVRTPDSTVMGTGILWEINDGAEDTPRIGTFATTYAVLQGAKEFRIVDQFDQTVAESSKTTSCYVSRSKNLVFVRLPTRLAKKLSLKGMDLDRTDQRREVRFTSVVGQNPTKGRSDADSSLAVGYSSDGRIYDCETKAFLKAGRAGGVSGLISDDIAPDNDDSPPGATPGNTLIELQMGREILNNGMGGGLLLDYHGRFRGLVLGSIELQNVILTADEVVGTWDDARHPAAQIRWRALHSNPFGGPSFFFMAPAPALATNDELRELAKKSVFLIMVQTERFLKAGGSILIRVENSEGGSRVGTFVTPYHVMEKARRFWVFDFRKRKVAEWPPPAEEPENSPATAVECDCFVARNRNLAFLRLPLNLSPEVSIAAIDILESAKRSQLDPLSSLVGFRMPYENTEDIPAYSLRLPEVETAEKLRILRGRIEPDENETPPGLLKLSVSTNVAAQDEMSGGIVFDRLRQFRGLFFGTHEPSRRNLIFQADLVASIWEEARYSYSNRRLRDSRLKKFEEKPFDKDTVFQISPEFGTNSANELQLLDIASKCVFKVIAHGTTNKVVHGSAVLIRLERTGNGVAARGTFVTAYHVLEGATKFVIKNHKDTDVAAASERTEAYTARNRDLAFIRLPLKLTVIKEIAEKSSEPYFRSFDWFHELHINLPGIAFGFSNEDTGQALNELPHREIRFEGTVRAGKDLVNESIEPDLFDIIPQNMTFRRLVGDPTDSGMSGGLVLDYRGHFGGLVGGRRRDKDNLAIPAEQVVEKWRMVTGNVGSAPWTVPWTRSFEKSSPFGRATLGFGMAP